MDTILWLCPPLSTETLKWLSSLPMLMQETFWWWQCSDRYMISLFPPTSIPPFSPSLINLMVSVDVKHDVYLSPLIRVPRFVIHVPGAPNAFISLMIRSTLAVCLSVIQVSLFRYPWSSLALCCPLFRVPRFVIRVPGAFGYCPFASAETIRPVIRDREPRTSTSSFTQLLNSVSVHFA